jgi:hypothetical protein
MKTVLRVVKNNSAPRQQDHGEMGFKPPKPVTRISPWNGWRIRQDLNLQPSDPKS